MTKSRLVDLLIKHITNEKNLNRSSQCDVCFVFIFFIYFSVTFKECSIKVLFGDRITCDSSQKLLKDTMISLCHSLLSVLYTL